MRIKSSILTCFFLISLVLLLSSCGGGAEAEISTPVPAEPKIEEVPDLKWSVVTVDKLEFQCSEGDFFVLEDKLFLKLKRFQYACTPTLEEYEWKLGELTSIKQICPLLFSEDQYWDASKTFEDSLGSKQMDSEDFAALDIDIENCPESIPTEYYNCAENIYLYRDISDSADCVDGKIKPYTTLFEFLKKQDTDDRCLDTDWTQIDRFTDGYAYFDVNGLLPNIDTGLSKEPAPGFILDNNGKICNPFNDKTRELVDPNLFCDHGYEPMKDIDSKTSDFGYCIGASKEEEAKAYSCKTSRHPEKENMVTELVILEPYTEEQKKYLSWYCLDYSLGGVEILNRLKEKTIAELYEAFPENCRDGIYHYSGEYVSDSLLANSYGEICNPFTGDMQKVEELCDIEYSESQLQDGITCLGEYYNIPHVGADCTFKMPEPGNLFHAFVVYPVPYERIDDLSWYCDGSDPSITRKTLYELYSKYCSSEYYYYDYNSDEFIVYENNGFTCCPNDGSIVKIEEGNDCGFKPIINPKMAFDEPEFTEGRCDLNGNYFEKYFYDVRVQFNDEYIERYDLRKKLDPWTTYKYCDGGEVKDKPLSQIAQEHGLSEGHDYFSYTGEFVVPSSFDRDQREPEEDILLVMDWNGYVRNPYTGQPMPVVPLKDSPDELHFCIYTYELYGASYQCLGDREFLEIYCMFNQDMDLPYDYDHSATHVELLKELSEQEAPFNCVDTNNDLTYEIVGESLSELFSESVCVDGIDYILCDPTDDVMCNEEGVLMLLDENDKVCNPYLPDYEEPYTIGAPCIGLKKVDPICNYNQLLIVYECKQPYAENIEGITFPDKVNFVYRAITDSVVMCEYNTDDGKYYPKTTT
ncbi:MAG: hypothetical protein KKF44_03670 [Nanoarchaeota archaeon]|nr:hypothetical protein [Nanoarchaeota archaeon]